MQRCLVTEFCLLLVCVMCMCLSMLWHPSTTLPPSKESLSVSSQTNYSKLQPKTFIRFQAAACPLSTVSVLKLRSHQRPSVYEPLRYQVEGVVHIGNYALPCIISLPALHPLQLSPVPGCRAWIPLRPKLYKWGGSCFMLPHKIPVHCRHTGCSPVSQTLTQHSSLI